MLRTIQSRTAYSGKLFSVEVLEVEDSDGNRYEREVVRHPGAVVIVPVLPGNRLAMIRNHRIAVDEQLWELPAGKLESGENPSDAARRELAEETGYAAAKIDPLGQFYTSPGFADELMHVFEAADLTFVGQRLDAGEDVEVAEVGIDDVYSMIADGTIRDGKTIAAVFMWSRFSEAGAS